MDDVFMDRHLRLAFVFKDTMQQLSANKKLRKATEKAKSEAKFYGATSKLDIEHRNDLPNKIEVTSERTFEAAKRLLGEGADKVAVLNFANSVRPGGGVFSGSGAQEECLCRCSNLYPTLDQDEFHEKYYGMHAKMKSPLASDAIIYSPGVTVFKSDTDYPEMLPEDEWYQVDVITCAAPNLYFRGDRMSDDEQYQIHFSRARRILDVALANGARALVLGAFGYGAFRNNPWMVAKAYKDALKEYKGAFELVVFAIFHTEREVENYRAFENELID